MNQKYILPIIIIIQCGSTSHQPIKAKNWFIPPLHLKCKQDPNSESEQVFLAHVHFLFFLPTAGIEMISLIGLE